MILHIFFFFFSDDGFHWQALAIPDKLIATRKTTTTTTSLSQSMNSSKYKNSKSLEVLLSNLSLSASLHITNLTTTLATDTMISTDKTAITKTIPQTTSTDAKFINGIFITEIPNGDKKHKIVSVTDTIPHTKVTPKTIPINMIDTTITISTDNHSTFYETNSLITSIFNSHLQSTLFDDKKLSNSKLVTNSLLKHIISSSPTTNAMIISSSQNANIAAGAQITETNFTKSYLHTERKIYKQQQQRKEDELKVKSDYNRLKANSTISPIITYSQSAPKTQLDQWEWERKQQQQQQQQQRQQAVNHEWINNKNNNNGDSDNHNNHNIFNNSHRISSSSSSSSLSLSTLLLSSSIFFTLPFSLFSFRFLLSL
uniref:Bm8067 n=1 Tax=Brugia malayi TaxID=6279 RepID=A0A0J9XLW1_BRUMA|nr:Bm8067 [Brugia malayi]